MAEWKYQEFGKFCHQFKRVNKNEEDLPVLSITKSDGLVLQSEKFKKRIATTKTAKYKRVRRGEFAYDPMSLYYGAIGRQLRVDEGLISPAYTSFRLDESINGHFFEQLIHSQIALRKYIEKTEGGNLDGKRKKTDWSAFASIGLLLPPLAEQKKIAEILGSVDDAIAATKAVIEQTKQVKKGLLQELLTKGIGHTKFKQTEIGKIPECWQVVSLGSVVEFQPGYAFKSREFVEDGDRLLRGSNVGIGVLEWSPGTTKYFPTERRYEFQEYLLHEHDIVIAMDRPFISAGFKVARVAKTDLPALLLQRVGRFRESKNIQSGFLWALMHSHFVEKHLRALEKGTDLPHISRNELESTLIPLPFVMEQQRISEIISACDDSLRSETKRLSQLTNAKAGLLQDLLTGKVRVSV